MAIEQADEEYQGEGTLAAAQRTFDDLFDNAPVILHSLDEQGKLIRVNRLWVDAMGYDNHEVLGRKSIDFLTEESRIRAVKDTLPLFWRSGSARSVGYQFVKEDGGLLDVLLDADVAQTPEGDRFTIAALRDRPDTELWRKAAATLRTLHELAEAQTTGGRLEVDLEYTRVSLDNRPVRLTAKEWAVLRILVHNLDKVIEPSQILQEAWGPESRHEIACVRVYINRLRKKLEPDPTHPRHILLERGIGYRLVLPD